MTGGHFGQVRFREPRRSECKKGGGEGVCWKLDSIIVVNVRGEAATAADRPICLCFSCHERILSEISGSQGGEYEDNSSLAYSAMLSRRIQTIRRCVLRSTHLWNVGTLQRVLSLGILLSQFSRHSAVVLERSTANTRRTVLSNRNAGRANSEKPALTNQQALSIQQECSASAQVIDWLTDSSPFTHD
jgi:hypothetical protein